MSIASDAKQYYSYLQKINQQNNQASAQQAEKQMAFQKQMSNTAHQREVADLKAAGLNPVLSAGGGSGGSSTPSGAMGDVDMSTASALTNYLGHLIQQQTSLAVAQQQAAATQAAAATSAAAVRYAADKQYEGTIAQVNSPNSWAGLARSVLQQMGWIKDPNSADGAAQGERTAIEVVNTGIQALGEKWNAASTYLKQIYVNGFARAFVYWQKGIHSVNGVSYRWMGDFIQAFIDNGNSLTSKHSTSAR